jgi:hypothetical protein
MCVNVFVGVCIIVCPCIIGCLCVLCTSLYVCVVYIIVSMCGVLPVWLPLHVAAAVDIQWTRYPHSCSTVSASYGTCRRGKEREKRRGKEREKRRGEKREGKRVKDNTGGKKGGEKREKSEEEERE